MNKLTYRQLKDFVNKIDEKHLDEPVIIYAEEEATHLEAAQIIKEPLTEYENGDMQHIIELQSEINTIIEEDLDDITVIRQIEPGLPMLFSDVNSSYHAMYVEFSIEIPESHE
jgi:hypothetical protein